MRAEALGTIWGLFRHHWVVFKFLITVFAMVVILIYMETFRQMALHAARNPSPLLHAVLGLVILLVATVLAIRIGSSTRLTLSYR